MNEELKDEVVCLKCNQIIKGKFLSTDFCSKELIVPIQCNHCKTEFTAIVETNIRLERK